MITASIPGNDSTNRIPRSDPIMNTLLEIPSVVVASGPTIVTLRTPVGDPIFVQLNPEKCVAFKVV